MMKFNVYWTFEKPTTSTVYSTKTLKLYFSYNNNTITLDSNKLLRPSHTGVRVMLLSSVWEISALLSLLLSLLVYFRLRWNNDFTSWRTTLLLNISFHKIICRICGVFNVFYVLFTLFIFKLIMSWERTNAGVMIALLWGQCAMSFTNQSVRPWKKKLL